MLLHGKRERADRRPVARLIVDRDQAARTRVGIDHTSAWTKLWNDACKDEAESVQAERVAAKTAVYIRVNFRPPRRWFQMSRSASRRTRTPVADDSRSDSVSGPSRPRRCADARRTDRESRAAPREAPRDRRRGGRRRAAAAGAWWMCDGPSSLPRRRRRRQRFGRSLTLPDTARASAAVHAV